MTTNGPENPIWDELLRDVDMSGLGDPNKLVNRIYVDKDATAEQNQVYDLTRAVLQPFEDYYREQVNDIAGAALPRGVSKNWRGRYNFIITTPSGLHIPVKFDVQKKGQTQEAKYFEVDNTQIMFDSAGRIIKVKLNSFSHLPRVWAFKARFYNLKVPQASDYDGTYMHLSIKDPTHMELEGGGYVSRRVKKDGILENYSDKNLFINAFRLAMYATDPRNN